MDVYILSVMYVPRSSIRDQGIVLHHYPCISWGKDAKSAIQNYINQTDERIDNEIVSITATLLDDHSIIGIIGNKLVLVMEKVEAKPEEKPEEDIDLKNIIIQLHDTGEIDTRVYYNLIRSGIWTIKQWQDVVSKRVKVRGIGDGGIDTMKQVQSKLFSMAKMTGTK